MFFEQPKFLIVALVIPLIVFLIIINYRRQVKFLTAWNLLTPKNKKKLIVRNLLLIVISLLLVFSTIGMKIKSPFGSSGSVLRKNIYFVLDISNSMKKNNKDKKAQKIITRMLPKLNGDRIGLILYSDYAYTMIPITSDTDYFKMILRSKTNKIKGRGSNFRSALSELIRRFIEIDSLGTLPKIGVVFTDGEHFGFDYSSKLQVLRKINVPLLIVKFSSQEAQLDSVPVLYSKSKILPCVSTCSPNEVYREIDKLISKTPEAIATDDRVLDLSYIALFIAFLLFVAFIFMKQTNA